MAQNITKKNQEKLKQYLESQKKNDTKLTKKQDKNNNRNA